ncbi:hypothetical protein MATL_G00207880 [Megalops atlanticus]|uniref:Uncharacterized protein n=1 Tax=Megalops atlanticus TaxID=7932 RepID=A0A9D3T0I3_MEGAT|nr:hypothetical protein MATL_G00207880 [Megalops atlanticus]
MSERHAREGRWSRVVLTVLFEKSSGISEAGKTDQILSDLGTLCVDSDVIFGFTSHLVKRQMKAGEGCPSRRTPLSGGKGLRSAEETQRSSRTSPEGSGCVAVSEMSPIEGGVGNWNLCQECLVNVAELRSQALLSADPATLQVCEA